MQSIRRRLCPILCPLASVLTCRIFDFSTLETQNGGFFGVNRYVAVITGALAPFKTTQVSVQRDNGVEKVAPDRAAPSSLRNLRASCCPLGSWSFRSERHAATIASIKIRHS